MKAVCSLCDGTDGCLVSSAEILSILPDAKKFNTESVDRAISDLHDDGYFDLITSSRAGEKMYVITLKDSGLHFGREKRQRAKDVAYKICLGFIGALATFVFGLILKAVSGG